MSQVPKKTKFHFIGIGGIGVSAVARVLHQKGAIIQGSDVRESQLTKSLRDLGIFVTIGHQAELVVDADFVVYSTAVPKNNIEWVEAKKRGIPCIHRSQALGMCLDTQESIGITGTHGKGTVSAMIAHGLMALDLDPTFIIGGLLNQYKTNSRLGTGPYAVAEIDESDGSHLNLNPHHVVVNNLEVDHLNYYDDLNAIIETMANFIEQNPNLKTLVLNWDDQGVRTLASHLSVPFLTYGIESEQVDIGIREIDDQGLSVAFSVYDHDQNLGRITLPLPGGYNAGNAGGALTLLLKAFNLPFDRVQHALNTYQGLENRFTVRQAKDVWIIKDYLSHPTGMKKVLESARRFPHKRIWCVFKPYRFTLMRYHAQDYAEAFNGADQVVITEMYAANETSISGIDTPWFVAQLRQADNLVHYVHDQNQITDFLEKRVQAQDMVFFFGGDDFFQMADTWADRRQKN
jgi:UDP-N-acetylmuramate--alanine ligase